MMKNIITPILCLLLGMSSLSYGQVFEIGEAIYGQNGNEGLGNEVSMNGQGDMIATSGLSGIVQAYAFNGLDWTPRGAALNGVLVELSESGNQLAIYNNNVTKVYSWDVNSSNWIQQGGDIPNKLKAFSDDGTTVVTIINNAVRAYTWSGISWNIKGNIMTGTDYGIDLSGNGNILAIANYSNNVKVYEWDNSNWQQHGSIIDNGTLSGFGASLSLSADGDRLAIGAPSTGSNRGKINLLDWVDGDWLSVYSDRFVTASNGTRFGERVALSADGTRILTEASFTGVGATARAYHGYWDNEIGEFVYSGELLPDSGSQRVSVGISTDGQKMLLGSRYVDQNGLSSGWAQVYISTSNYICTVSEFDDFETDWGLWNDGGTNCQRSLGDSIHANGDYCVRIDFDGFTTSNNISVSQYDRLDIYYRYGIVGASSADPNEFSLELSTDGGISFQAIESIDDSGGLGFYDPVTFLYTTVRHSRAQFIAQETGQILLRFQGDFPTTIDHIYLDDIEISQCLDPSNFPTCTDNIQNGNETGVDCGGNSCSSCDTIYVDPTATLGNNNGTSWGNAYLDLQNAISNGQGKTIKIVEGTYYPTNTTDRNVSFELPEGTKLFGGYSLDGGERDEDEFKTILSGNLGGGNNSYHVVEVIGKMDVELNGITIRDGKADDTNSFERARGGGVYIKNSKVILDNVQTVWNRGEFGAGLYAWDNSELIIKNSEFKSNLATEGSDIYVNDIAELTLDKSLFVQKRSSSQSAIEVHNADLITIEQSIIENDPAATVATDLLKIFADTKNAELNINATTIINQGNEMDLVHLESQANVSLMANIYNTIIGHANNHLSAIDIVDNGTMNLNFYNSYIQTEPGLGTKINCQYQNSDGLLNFLVGTYTLDKCSPGIDGGDDSYASSFVTDFNNQHRFFGIIDMGATESRLSCYADIPSLAWLATMGNNLPNYGRDVVTDKQGNVYTLAMSGEMVDYDPSPALSFEYVSGDISPLAIHKMNANMELEWYRLIGDYMNYDDTNYGISIQTDTEGNVVVLGAFSTGLDYNGQDHGNSAQYNNDYKYSPFVLKLDPLGNLIYVKTIPIYLISPYGSMVLDQNNNILIKGKYYSLTSSDSDFDPGPGVESRTTAYETAKDFLLKLDANGDFVWVKTFAGRYLYADSFSRSFKYGDLAIDSNGNIVISGSYGGTRDFYPGSGTYLLTAEHNPSINNYNDYLLKLDSNGGFIWTKNVGDNYGLTIDKDNDIYSIGQTHLYKFDPSGTLIWTKPNPARDIITDANGDVYLTGNFSDTYNTDAGNTDFTLTSAGEGDIFIQKLDGDGNHLWAIRAGDIGDDEANGIDIDPAGNILVTGMYDSQFNVDDEFIQNFNGPTGIQNIFILKLGQSNAGIPIYVDETATGFNNGRSWQDAFPSLQDALSLAEDKTVYIAEGTYLPSVNGNRNDAFEIPSEAHLIGGFEAGGSTTPNPSLNTTILSGNVDNIGNYDGNSYHVVKVINSDNATLEGLTIKEGNANDASSFGRARGGGLYVKSSTLILKEMDIRRNKAIYGAGIFATLSPELRIENSTLKLNTADFGSAIYHSNETQLFIEHSKIFDNTANNRSTIEVNNSLYTEITNSLIANNTSANANGIGFIATNRNQICNIYNSTILGAAANKNLLTMQIGFGDELGVNIENSIIAQQDLSFDKNVIAFNNGTLNFTTQNSYIQGSSIIGTSNNNLYSATAGDLLLNADYSLMPCSPAVDAGDNTSVTNTTDIEGNNRIYNIVDIGAFESQDDCPLPREIKEVSKLLSIQPNPTQGIIYLATTLENFELSVYNILGEQVLQVKNPNEIDLKDYVPGIYLLNIWNNGELIQVEKVIKR